MNSAFRHPRFAFSQWIYSYFCGDAFKGRVFCKYIDGQVADDAIRAFGSKTLIYKGQKITCKPDLPVHQRVPVSFLLGLRRHLIDKWGLWVKVDDTLPVPVMSILGQPVAKARVVNDTIEVEWMDGAWADWKDLHDAPEYIKLKEDSDKRLGHAAEYNKKKGKGKRHNGKAGASQ